MQISNITIGTRESSITKRRTQLGIMSKQFGGDRETLDLKIFTAPDFSERVIEWLTSKYSQNTVKSYIGAILAFGEQYSIPTQCYKKLKKYLNDIGEIESTTIVDEQFMEKLDKCYETTKNRNVRLLIDIIRYVGPIRMCELIKTKVDKDDGINNFIDMEKGMWYLTEDGTKTGTRREFSITPEAIQAIKNHLYCDSEWLILAGNFDPYSTTASLSSIFIRATTITFKTVRKSYIEIANRDKDSLYVVNLANIMGHKVSTQMSDYAISPPLGFVSGIIPTEAIKIFKQCVPVAYCCIGGIKSDLDGVDTPDRIKSEKENCYHPWSKDSHFKIDITPGLDNTINKLFPDLKGKYSLEIRSDFKGITVPYHSDSDFYGEIIYMICLEGEYIIDMIDDPDLRKPTKFQKTMFPGDYVRLSEDARYVWQHSIKVKESKLSMILRIGNSRTNPGSGRIKVNIKLRNQ